MKAEYQTALVLGLGVSGEAAAELLLAEGACVTVVDADDRDELQDRAMGLREMGADVRLGAGALPDGPFAVCVTSPGIASASGWIRDIEARGTPVISELELGASRCASSLLAVTGTNGKSTFVKFCGSALEAAGIPAVVAGNYGYPLCRAVREVPDAAWVVAEVSSFQLEHAPLFHPRVGVLLNIQADHLDRHGTLAEYRRLKFSLFSRQGSSDVAIVPLEECSAVRAFSTGDPSWLTFGRLDDADYRYAGGRVEWCEGGAQSVSVRESFFDNDVSGVAAAAAVAALRRCGVDADRIESSFRSFRPLPHRMEPVAVVNGVRFVNDSKATNLAAMAAGVRMAGGPVHLIAGGILKESDLKSVKEVLVSCVKGVYLIGESLETMLEAWHDAVTCRACGRLDVALRDAGSTAERGDVVLLSPGCASFDQFVSYEDRGNQFIRLVRAHAADEEAGGGESR